MGKAKAEALAARLDVHALALRELVRLLPATVAAQYADALRAP